MFTMPVNYTVIAGFLAADFNKDGAVDGVDLAAWEGSFGLAIGASKAQGDADNDGDVDGADFAQWQTQLGLLPEGLAPAAAVPEPVTASLAGLLAASILIAARRRAGGPLNPGRRRTRRIRIRATSSRGGTARCAA
jgi:hypothetical protein